MPAAFPTSPFRDDLFAGKKVLITGGGTGMGRAMTRAFAAHGADVFITSRKEENLKPTADEVSQATGREVRWKTCDVREMDQVESMMDAASDWFGGHVDVLVNNAAVIEAAIDATEGGDFGTHLPMWDTVMDVNLRAPVELTWRLAQGMMARGAGCVVNVASVAGKYALTDAPLYSLSKAGLMHFTRQAALRYAPKVRVNAVAPGWTETGFNQGKIMDAGFQKAIARHIPQRRLAAPEEVADAILWLVKGASYVTGTTVTVDGGLVAELR